MSSYSCYLLFTFKLLVRIQTLVLKLDPSTYQDNYHEFQGPFRNGLRVVDNFQNPLPPTQTHNLNSKLKLEVLTEAVFQLPDGMILKFTNLLAGGRGGRRRE